MRARTGLIFREREPVRGRHGTRRARERGGVTLDHVFVIARPGRGEDLVDGSCATAGRWTHALVDAGFTEGSAQRHPGQGTANRRFFFERFMLELLYVDDEPGLDDERARVLSLRERVSTPSASPFGIGCRPSTTDDCTPSFAAVAYHPAYLPGTLHIDVACEIGVEAPLLFHLPFLSPFDHSAADDEPREHANGTDRLEAIELHGPGEHAGRLMRDAGVATVDGGRTHWMSMRFGNDRFDAASIEQLPMPEDLPLTISIQR